ncbi:MAG: hypothetical protein OXB92_12690 [Acidimicrobiaceae bacterium]|nr:hypothetical protein [Acidimicrobiia bacterium]MCY4494705.1 hypothetical protein [Acidimicrobiaceae bacterium]
MNHAVPFQGMSAESHGQCLLELLGGGHPFDAARVGLAVGGESAGVLVEEGSAALLKLGDL